MLSGKKIPIKPSKSVNPPTPKKKANLTPQKDPKKAPPKRKHTTVLSANEKQDFKENVEANQGFSNNLVQEDNLKKKVLTPEQAMEIEFKYFSQRCNICYVGSVLKNKKADSFKVLEKVGISEIEAFPQYVDGQKGDPIMKDLGRWYVFMKQHYDQFRKIIYNETQDKGAEYFLRMVKNMVNDKTHDSSILVYIGNANAKGELLLQNKEKVETVKFEDVFKIWKNRKSKQKHFLIIIESNYSGQWSKKLSQEPRDDMSVFASCKHNQKSKYSEVGGYFTHNVMKFLHKQHERDINLPKGQELDFQGNYKYLKRDINLFFKFSKWLKMEESMKCETWVSQGPQSIHFGYYKNLMKYSWGHLKWTNGPIKGTFYHGEFGEGRFNGEGILCLPDGRRIEGHFKNNKIHGVAREYAVNGDFYDGEWYRNLKKGQGVMKFNNGDVYEGEFAMNYPHGKGKYINIDGSIYEGDMYKGFMHGQGKITYYNGDSYEGGFKKGLKNGHGVYTYKNGTTYEGEFRDGKKHGQGAEKEENGNTFQGAWQEGDKHGEGLYDRKHNGMKSEKWKKGVSGEKVAFYLKQGSRRVVMKQRQQFKL